MILVTGGLGFIGSHIALSLMAQGQEVVLVDNLANSTLQTLERLEYISGMYVPFVKLDVRNTPALNKVFEQYSIDAVIHTAGFKSIEESNLKPPEYYNDNVSCIMSLLRAMQRTGVRHFIHLSSLAVYGKSGSQLSETDDFNYAYPNPYIKSQQMIEEIIRDTYKIDHEWKIAILRLSNIVGAFEHGVLGEYVAQLPKNIVPLAMQVAAMQRDLIELQDQSSTEDHTVERSFLHVLDVCEAVSLDEISQVTQAEIPTQSAIYKHEELAQIGANIGKAKTLLQWAPKRTLKQMIEDEWRFYQNTLNGR